MLMLRWKSMNGNNQKQVFFVISGLGLGNSTRCLALMEQLTTRGIICDVATFGKGLQYFNGRPLVRNLISLKSISCLSFRWMHLILSALHFIWVTCCNDWIVYQAAKKYHIDLIVYDSVYGILPRFLLSHCKVISLNNADRIVDEVRQSLNLPPSTWLQFLLVECFDFFFQRVIPQWVLSPWPLRYSTDRERQNRHFVDIEPIVRPPLIGPRLRQNPPQVYVSASGSGLNCDLDSLLGQVALVMKAEVIAKPSLEMALKDNTYCLNKADILLCNGGFSSLSEGLYRQIPMVMVPLSRHSEQWINAKLMERLGSAVVIEEAKIKKIDSGWLLTQLRKIQHTSRLSPTSCRGANQAADFITGLLAKQIAPNVDRNNERYQK